MQHDTLTFQPRFELIRQQFNAFWEDEPPKRPLVWAEVPRDPARPFRESDSLQALRYFRAARGEWAEQLACVERWLESTLFLGEAIPYFAPDFGPDQFAAFLGAPLHFSETNPETNWVEPILESLEGFNPAINGGSVVWNGILEYARTVAEHARGRYLVGVCDFHSNMDAISALRSPQNLCMDLLDCPGEVARVSAALKDLYCPVYAALYGASGFNSQTGTIGWAPFWAPGRFAVVQADFSCMIGSGDFRRHVLPGIQREAASLDRSMYHLDGPDALRHLDDVLGLPEIDILQWVPGAGQKPMWQWTGVLKRGLAAGKALYIYDITPEQVKFVHRELRSRRCLYHVNASSAQEVESLLAWLEKH
ncbi:MAG: hypothetical protein PHQ12_02485 [Chthoniobacteraceae bacterium]|nr:hypothetical protein [Chthoniobacteraceae bacterium]